MKKPLIIILYTFIGMVLPTIIHAQWIPQATAFKERRGLWDISIADENTVWALAYRASGGIYASVPEFTKTIDGGATWTVGTFPAGLQWGSISAISDKIAWVMANHIGTGGAAIFKTTDGGRIWRQQGVNEIFDVNSGGNFVHGSWAGPAPRRRLANCGNGSGGSCGSGSKT